MHIKVTDILNQETGHSVNFQIEGERPDLEDLHPEQPVDGSLRLIRTETGILASGEFETAIELDCHRCLRAFSWPVKFISNAEFEPAPSEDQWPIAKHEEIDLAPWLRQEVILATPIKQLCQADCPGLCLECGERLEQQHSHKKG